MSEEATQIESFLEERGYLTINQLATLLRLKYPLKSVAYPTLKRFMEKGYFRYSKIGGQFRIEKESIYAYIQHGTDGLTPTSPLSGSATENVEIPIISE